MDLLGPPIWFNEIAIIHNVTKILCSLPSTSPFIVTLPCFQLCRRSSCKWSLRSSPYFSSSSGRGENNGTFKPSRDTTTDHCSEWCQIKWSRLVGVSFGGNICVTLKLSWAFWGSVAQTEDSDILETNTNIPIICVAHTCTAAGVNQIWPMNGANKPHDESQMVSKINYWYRVPTENNVVPVLSAH